ncbi:hypothetical protein CDIK_4544 [Cucumispora dikerogammari]|nr:hypothetical protein CDIK_4544 [Cucumispora dikerogammari]
MQKYTAGHMRTLVESISDPKSYVFGDSAYGEFNKIIFAASTNTFPLTLDEEYLYSQQRIIVENAFGKLKGKFRRFESRIVNEIQKKSINSIMSILWIHNFIIDNN